MQLIFTNLIFRNAYFVLKLLLTILGHSLIMLSTSKDSSCSHIAPLSLCLFFFFFNLLLYLSLHFSWIWLRMLIR